MIPKIIHAIWIGPLQPPMKLLNTWLKKNPGWEFRLWNSNSLPWKNRERIDCIPELNGKADIMRYEILAEHGGIYVDADMECLRPLDEEPSFREHEAWACYENETVRPGLVATTVLGAHPHSPLFLDLVEGITKITPTYLRNAAAWVSVGPVYLTQTIARHPSTHLYPARAFLPEHYDNTPAPGDFPSYGRHHWGTTRNQWPKLASE